MSPWFDERRAARKFEKLQISACGPNGPWVHRRLARKRAAPRRRNGGDPGKRPRKKVKIVTCFWFRFRIVSALLTDSETAPTGSPKLPGEAFVVSEASSFETAKKLLKKVG